MSRTPTNPTRTEDDLRSRVAVRRALDETLPDNAKDRAVTKVVDTALGVVRVIHGLGRKVTGWEVTRYRNAVVLLVEIESDEKMISFAVSGAAKLDLRIY